MGPPPEHMRDLTVARLISPETRDWNKEAMIRSIIPNHEEQILELKPSKKRAQDTIIWLLTDDGIYSAKKGYYWAIKVEEELRRAEGQMEFEGEN